MTSFTKLVLPLLLFATCIILCNGVHIQIINELDPPTSLDLHCKSKDDDLGPTVLSPHGSYSFKFMPNFFKTTLFFCKVVFGGSVHHFDAFDRDRDSFFYGYWKIRQGGPCKQEKAVPSEKASPEECIAWKN